LDTQPKLEKDVAGKQALAQVAVSGIAIKPVAFVA
jgi:hypothetical protein